MRSGKLKNDYYLFLGVRSIVRRIIQLAKESIDKFGDVLKHENFADIAIAFYLINESLEGDLALKTSLDIAEKLQDDVVFEIVYSLIESNLLEKAGYAMNLVKNRKKLDIILSYLALHLYKEGREEDAAKAIAHI